MATIEDVVKIDINRETSTVTLRDLQTMLILTEHEAFTEDYRIYTEARQMLEDGFKVDDKAYKAASKAFSQDPRPAKVMIGRKGVGESYVDAIVRQQGANSKFFYLITDAKDDTDKEAISDYVETQNRMFYAFSDKNPDTATAAETDIFSKLKAKGHLKTIGMWYQNDANEMIEAGYVARFSSEIIGSAVWIYKPLSGFVAEKVTPTQKTHLFSKNANYYTNVEDDSVVFGEGKAVGGEWFDVLLGISWLEIRMGERIWEVIKNANKIAFTNAGIAMIVIKVREVLGEAVEMGILTDEDPIVVRYPNATNVPSFTRAKRTLTGITFDARLAGAIIVVDKITGRVYA